MLYIIRLWKNRGCLTVLALPSYMILPSSSIYGASYFQPWIFFRWISRQNRDSYMGNHGYAKIPHTSIDPARFSKMGLSENVGYIPNEIAIFHRDNDQQNHWVQWGTLFSDTPKWIHTGNIVDMAAIPARRRRRSWRSPALRWIAVPGCAWKKDEQWPSPGWWTGNSATWFLPELDNDKYIYICNYIHTHTIYIYIFYIYIHIIVDK